MDITGSDAVSSARAVREGVLAAMRRRRSRDATRRLWQVAPLVAAGAVVAALVARLMEWPAAVPIAVLVVGAAALALYVAVARRTRGITDALAARVDDEAGLGGELRSATWFASREGRDEWADVHVIRAARRLQQVDPHQLYPAVRAPRSALVTLALVVTAAALAATFPEPGAAPGAAASDRRQTVTRDALRLADALPPELLRRLEALLAAAEAGDSAAVRALAANGDLQELLDRAAASGDPALLEALARSLAADPDSARAAEALADRARAAADSAAMSAAMRNALAELADQLELVGPEQTASGAGSESAPSETAAAEGAGGQAGATSGAEQLTIQFAEETESGGTGGIMLLSNQEASEGGGAPGAGFGGADTPEAGGQTAEIDAALRREVVAAHQDAPGAGSDTEMHRRTAQAEAATAFTRSAAGKFDAAPSAAPPPVPEARRSGLRSYFVRVPQ